MQRFGFTPADTSSGGLCLSVFYRSSLLDISSESSTPLCSQFLLDYVGSPLADPLKRFPHVPLSHGSTSSPILKEIADLAPHPPETSLAHKKSRNFDEYRLSPTFSPSPSPSPPIYVPGNHLPKALLCSESAPVNVPGPKLAISTALSNRQSLLPSPPCKLTNPHTSEADNTVGPIQIGATLDKIFYLLSIVILQFQE
ncbi:hypothetical protein SLEP1_g8525 [Rubroshorea leprosula]|uniref:Uncharacterized protein n=1 Tax=Rubroshorea leprosula TaxID=152421 RepID=A0AAV5ICW9_9ROSI|nr:hypothetical protein SLEP1_g8525 [Rubroshorea leprosula]